MIGVKTIPMTMISVPFEGPSATRETSAENDERDREEGVDDPHDHVVDEPAEVAGDQAERRAEDRAEQGRRQRDGDDVARSDDDAREHVAPELVRAEEVRGRGASSLSARSAA